MTARKLVEYIIRDKHGGHWTAYAPESRAKAQEMVQVLSELYGYAAPFTAHKRTITEERIK